MKLDLVNVNKLLHSHNTELIHRNLHFLFFKSNMRPCWRDDEALAEYVNALVGGLHTALDVQHRSGSWQLQCAEDLVGEGADDLHRTIALLLLCLLRRIPAAAAAAVAAAWGCHTSLALHRQNPSDLDLSHVAV